MIKNNILEIINKKKMNGILSYEELSYVAQNYLSGDIQDYQIASLLMAIRLTDLHHDEAANLTKVFVDNSKKYHFKSKRIILDKHSSGGVGDKITLIVTPILASLGYDVCKISGRGLGHTGGTIDKLEALNVKTIFTDDQIQSILDKNNCFILQQSEDVVPVDRKFYALRDVTGTVDALELAASSILSKKFIINSDYIFLDIKVGDGAVFKNLQQAKKFVNLLIHIANFLKRKIVIHLTNMDDVLGRCVGNALEVCETIDFLLNKEQEPILKSLVYEFLIDILIDTKKVKTVSEATALINKSIISEDAYKRFVQLVKLQKGDFKKIPNNAFFNPKYEKVIKAKQDGYLIYNSCQKIGEVAIMLGAGRITKADKIDFQAGIKLVRKKGDLVKANEPIAILYSNSKITTNTIQEFNSNITYSKHKIKKQKIILGKRSN